MERSGCAAPSLGVSVDPDHDPRAEDHPGQSGLLELAKQLGNVSQQGDRLLARQLLPLQGALRRRRRTRPSGADRRKPLLANRTAPEIEADILALSLEQPAFGPIRVANEMHKQGHCVSPAGVRGVWQRRDLETVKKRLKALEAKVAQEGLVLTEGQLAALERLRPIRNPCR